MTKHHHWLVLVVRELGPEPFELVRRQRARIAPAPGLVVGVDPEHPQTVERPTEVAALVTRKELVVEAVVAFPFPDPTLRVLTTGVGTIVIAASDEVVVLMLPEAVEQLARPAEVEGHSLGSDIARGEQVSRTEFSSVFDHRFEHHLGVRRAARQLAHAFDLRDTSN